MPHVTMKRDGPRRLPRGKAAGLWDGITEAGWLASGPSTWPRNQTEITLEVCAPGKANRTGEKSIWVITNLPVPWGRLAASLRDPPCHHLSTGSCVAILVQPKPVPDAATAKESFVRLRGAPCWRCWMSYFKIRFISRKDVGEPMPQWKMNEICQTPVSLPLDQIDPALRSGRYHV